MIIIKKLAAPYVDSMGFTHSGDSALLDDGRIVCVDDRDELEGMKRVIEEAQKRGAMAPTHNEFDQAV